MRREWEGAGWEGVGGFVVWVVMLWRSSRGGGVNLTGYARLTGRADVRSAVQAIQHKTTCELTQ